MFPQRSGELVYVLGIVISRMVVTRVVIGVHAFGHLFCPSPPRTTGLAPRHSESEVLGRSGVSL